MKKLIVLSALLTVIAFATFAMARGNNSWFAIQQQSKQVQAQQKQQDRQFKALEREAAKNIDTLSGESSYKRPKNAACPYCLRCCTR